MNDFAIWKGHFPASCLLGKFAYIRLLGPENLLPWWSTIYDSGGRTKWKSLAKNPQLMIQQRCRWCGPEQSLGSKGPLLVLHLPLALHCWPHSSPSGKLTPPADHWLIAPGAQGRPDTKVPSCHPAYVQLFCLPPHSHHIWEPAPTPRHGEALTCLELKQAPWAEWHGDISRRIGWETAPLSRAWEEKQGVPVTLWHPRVSAFRNKNKINK